MRIRIAITRGPACDNQKTTLPTVALQTYWTFINPCCHLVWCVCC